MSLRSSSWCCLLMLCAAMTAAEGDDVLAELRAARQAEVMPDGRIARAWDALATEARAPGFALALVWDEAQASAGDPAR